jgi:glycosyltransferase involved in cell wall biosynthesis
MKVSIITLTYNSEKAILRCLQSIHSQSYKNIEHIIIDGKSTDNTIQIINEHSAKSILISEKDAGIYDAWNKGMKLATGDIVGTVMSDDYLKNEHSIQSIVEAFQKENCDIVYGNMDFVLNSEIIRKWRAGNFKKYKYYFGWMPPPPAVYVKKNIIKENKLFNLKYKIGADYEWLLRLFYIKNYNIFYLDKFIYTLEYGGISNKSLKNVFDGNMENYYAWKDNNLSQFPFWVPLKPLFKIFQIKKLSSFFRFYLKKPT